MLLPALAKRLDLTIVVDQPEVSFDAVPVVQYDAFRKSIGEYDAFICQIGNNPYHETIYSFAMEHPSIVVLHDVVLHHLIVEMTLARGLVDEYIQALRENHGEPGAAWARARVAGMHDEIGNFFFPASRELVRHSRGVLVHSDYAVELVRSFETDTPVMKVNHPYAASEVESDRARDEYRRKLSFPSDAIIVGMFGFVTSAKRPEVVLEAFADALRREPRLRLLIVGEAAPNIELQRLARDKGLADDQWFATGYVDDAAFDHWLAAVDRVVNLRYPSAGETSGALYHIIAAEKPVAVSDYASFSDLPAGVVTKIAIDEHEMQQLVDFLAGDGSTDAAAQKLWLQESGSLDRTVATYSRALEGQFPKRSFSSHVQQPIALFPHWQLLQSKATPHAITFELKNLTTDVIQNPTYLTPAYRVVVKFFSGSNEVSSRWLSPPRDIPPGGSVCWTVARAPGATVMELHHAQEMIPPAGGSRFVRLELAT
jgi:glycosyltransferase involved in cell wall biosynthesis